MPEMSVGADLNLFRSFPPGNYEVKPLGETRYTKLEIACFDKNVKSLVHYHPHADETYYVAEGEAIYRQDKRLLEGPRRSGKKTVIRYEIEEIKAKPGFLMLFQPNKIHQVEAVTQLRLVRILSSPVGDFSAVEARDWSSIKPPNAF